MEIRKLNLETLTKDQFTQIVEIERNCGLEPYTPDMLMQEIGMFEELSENLTYPQTAPMLYREAEKLLKLLEKSN